MPTWLLLLSPVVAGLTLIATASDSYVWSFNLGLLLLAVGLMVPWFRWAWRLHRHPGQLWRISGRVIGLGAITVTILGSIVFFDHRLLFFRRADAQQWKQDVAELRPQVDRLPEGLARARGGAMRAVLDRFEQQIDTLDEDHRQLVLMQALAALADGHSIAFPFFPSTDFTLVPLQVRRFDDGWFVVDAAGRFREMVGSQVTHLNGIPVDDTYRAMAPYVSADNEASRLSRASLYLMSPNLVAAATGRTDVDLTLSLRSPSGSSQEVRARGAAPWRYLVWRFDPRSYESRSWWTTELQNQKAVVMTIRGIRGQGDAPFVSLATTALDAARRISATRLILDARGNGGGDNTLLPRFVSTLASSEFNTPGRLFVLTDADTFSAATNLVSLMESQTSAILIGTPTGSGPNHFGDSGPVRLPGTGTMVFLSTRYHQFGASGDIRTTHEPTRRIALLSSDFFAGRDAVLEAALRW